MADERLLPAGIRDESTRAYNEILDRFGEIDLTALLVYLINRVEASALPHLIEQFHIQGYEGGDLAGTEEQKRAVIKGSITLHRHKGTKYAVIEALKALGITSRVKEWFEYAGQPYKFKVEVDLEDRGLDLAFVQKVEDTIGEWKNARSHLEALLLYVESRGSVPKYACAALMGEVVTVQPYQETNIEGTGLAPAYIGGLIGVETITINPQ